MRVQDLKTGDWVEVDGRKRRVYEVIAYSDSAENKVRVLEQWLKQKNVYVRHPIFEKDIKPIPLTADILTANGFRPQWDYIFTFPANKPNELWLWDKDGEWEVTYNNNDLLTTIRFVHELQHLLWALGLDDNLKVE